MDSAKTHEILPGLSIDASGQATVDRRMGALLFDLAIELEAAASAPVDVEHVLAAIVLSCRAGQIDSTTSLTSDNAALLDALRVQIETVFDQYGGRLGQDEF